MTNCKNKVWRISQFLSIYLTTSKGKGKLDATHFLGPENGAADAVCRQRGDVFLITVTRHLFDRLPDGREVTAFVLANTAGMEITVLDYGGILQSIRVPAAGGAVDVVRGYPDLDGYLANSGYIGALIGRNANRIAGAAVEIDGVRCPLTANEGTKQLHGGIRGFNQKLFDAAEIAGGVELRCTSADGEEGFPGEVRLTAGCTLDDDGALTLDYRAVTTRDTIVNLTNHSYFNLNGGGTAMAHRLQIFASHMTPIDESAIPTGEIVPVAGTPFDFLVPHAPAERIGQDDWQLHCGGGYDHNFALDKSAPGALETAAVLEGERSGIRMECRTTCPGLQLYTANFLGGCKVPGKDGSILGNREAVCLETQYFPDANAHRNFPSTILCAGDTWHETTVYAFSAR